MIEISLTHLDLARVRFAHSPLRELLASLRVMRDPGLAQLYRRWLVAVSGRLDGLDMPLLTALAPVGAQMCGFLTPRLIRPSPALEDELAMVAAVNPAAVRDEMELAARGGPIPEPLRPLYDDPVTALPRVLDELARYWAAAVAPFWSQVRGIATADVSYRTERFAAGGVARVFVNLHPEITLDGDRLLIDKLRHSNQRYSLNGEGIVLLPCAFSWPALLVSRRDGGQLSLTYPARGIAGIGTEPYIAQRHPLSTLIGRTKTSLLVALKHPKCTTELAKELNISAASVSQQLKILKAAELTTSRRDGRLVYYQRTPSATALLTSSRTNYDPLARNGRATMGSPGSDS
jgi:DNA-binding transcriptional ArsR family regulator